MDLVMIEYFYTYLAIGFVIGLIAKVEGGNDASRSYLENMGISRIKIVIFSTFLWLPILFKYVRKVYFKLW